MAIDDKAQAALYARLQSLDTKLIQLDKASFIDKGAMAQIVVNETRDLLGALIVDHHLLSNEIYRLKALIK